MAYRGGAGKWVAIVILAVFTVMFGALYLNREADIKTLKSAITNETIESLAGEKWGNKHAREILQTVKDREETIVKLRESLADKEQTIKDYVDATSEQSKQAQVLNQRNQELKTEIKNLEISNKELNEKFDKVRRERNEQLETDNQNLHESYNKLQARSDVLRKKLKNMETLQEALLKAAQRQIMEVRRENNSLRQVIEKFEKESRGRVHLLSEQYDGKIIQADIDNKFVVVDLGRVHKINRGMRFDVIRWRLNKWDYMGAIQITKVGTTTSQGVILSAIRQQKIDPVTGWVATDPEMKFSPYASTGTDNDKVVQLVKTDVVEKPSMRKLDPIVVGDFITNPLYSRKRTMKFVVAGQPVHYSTNEIKQQIINYGGIIQDDVDVDTDYLVLGKIPEESAVAELDNDVLTKLREKAVKALATAKEYGVPVMREVELFSIIRP